MDAVDAAAATALGDGERLARAAISARPASTPVLSTRMTLFIARWPDGSAWIVDAESMSDVAEILDEVADPGACEVQEYAGPFAIELRPASAPQGGAIFEFSRRTATPPTTCWRPFSRPPFHDFRSRSTPPEV